MELIKKFKYPILIALIFVGLVIWLPETATQSTQVTWDYFKEMALIIPPDIYSHGADGSMGS